jgi:hypothetical protein
MVIKTGAEKEVGSQPRQRLKTLTAVGEKSCKRLLEKNE